MLLIGLFAVENECKQENAHTQSELMTSYYTAVSLFVSIQTGLT